jgi:hypothetical protein
MAGTISKFFSSKFIQRVARAIGSILPLVSPLNLACIVLNLAFGRNGAFHTAPFEILNPRNAAARNAEP